MDRRILAFALLCLFASYPSHAQEFKVWDRAVQVHGFFSQGFMKTDENNWLTMNTRQGSGAMTEMGLNISSQLTDRFRVGAQVYDRNLGQLGQWHPSLDWAVAARTKGAIGDVGGSTNTVGVKVLVVTSVESKGERVLLTRVEPIYPETLQRLGIGGSVRLELTISPKGAVESVAILGGNPILAEAAVQATKQWVYAPGPSQTRTHVIVPFEPSPLTPECGSARLDHIAEQGSRERSSQRIRIGWLRRSPGAGPRLATADRAHLHSYRAIITPPFTRKESHATLRRRAVGSHPARSLFRCRCR
jgi:TonB family protein